MSMTTEQTKIRLTTDEMKELRRLADNCGIQLTALGSLFVRAAMSAVKENDNRFHMPLKLEVSAEPITKSKK
jgi:hypothetical protein